MEKIIAVVSGKGGVGVSSVCALLGMSLSEKGNKVLLIDTNDGFRTLDTMFGVSDEVFFDISDIVSGNCDVKDAVKGLPGNENLCILPASNSPDNALSPDIMKNLISELKSSYDFIILDVPNKRDRKMYSALSQIDLALIVTQATVVSAKAAKEIKFYLTEAGVEEIRLVINNFSAKRFWKTAGFKDLDEVIDETGTRLIAVIPTQEGDLTVDLKNTSRRTRAYRAIENLACRVCGEEKPLCYRYLK